LYIYLPFQIEDNIRLFLLAGYETTASTLTFLIWLLAKHQEWQNELRHEIMSVASCITELTPEKLEHLPNLAATIKEVLRLFSIAPFIERKSLECITLPTNVILPINRNILIMSHCLNFSDKVWACAGEFQPARFLSGVPHPLFIPFGIGSRMCIGQQFAILEMKFVISALLLHYHFSPTQYTPVQLGMAVDWVHAVSHPDSKIALQFWPVN